MFEGEITFQFALQCAGTLFVAFWLSVYLSRLFGSDLLRLLATWIEPVRRVFWAVGDFLHRQLYRIPQILRDLMRVLERIWDKMIELLRRLRLVEIFNSFVDCWLFLFWVAATPFLVLRGLIGLPFKTYAESVEKWIRAYGRMNLLIACYLCALAALAVWSGRPEIVIMSGCIVGAIMAFVMMSRSNSQ